MTNPVLYDMVLFIGETKVITSLADCRFPGSLPIQYSPIVDTTSAFVYSLNHTVLLLPVMEMFRLLFVASVVTTKEV